MVSRVFISNLIDSSTMYHDFRDDPLFLEQCKKYHHQGLQQQEIVDILQEKHAYDIK
jgi:hypothetical protein